MQKQQAISLMQMPNQICCTSNPYLSKYKQKEYRYSKMKRYLILIHSNREKAKKPRKPKFFPKFPDHVFIAYTPEEGCCIEGLERGIACTPPATLFGPRFSDPPGGVDCGKREEARRGDSLPAAFCSVTRDPQNWRLAACLRGD